MSEQPATYTAYLVPIKRMTGEARIRCALAACDRKVRLVLVHPEYMPESGEVDGVPVYSEGWCADDLVYLGVEVAL